MMAGSFLLTTISTWESDVHGIGSHSSPFLVSIVTNTNQDMPPGDSESMAGGTSPEKAIGGVTRFARPRQERDSEAGGKLEAVGLSLSLKRLQLLN